MRHARVGDRRAKQDQFLKLGEGPDMGETGVVEVAAIGQVEIDEIRHAGDVFQATAGDRGLCDVEVANLRQSLEVFQSVVVDLSLGDGDQVELVHLRHVGQGGVGDIGLVEAE